MTTAGIDFGPVSREGLAVVRDDRIVSANAAFCRLTGLEENELRGKPVSAFFSGDDRRRVARFLETVGRGNTDAEHMEASVVVEGASTLVDMVLCPRTHGGALAVFVSCLDISDRRVDRQELERVKDRLESILHSLRDVVVSLSPEGTILSINPAAERLYGVSLRRFRGATEADVLHFVHPEDRGRVFAFYRGLPDMEYGQMEYRILTEKKDVRWVHDEGYIAYCRSGNILRLDHVLRDITEEKTMLFALTRSEEKYRDFFHRTRDMAFCVTPEGVFFDINDAGVRLLGLADRETALRTRVEEYFADKGEYAALMADLARQEHVANRHVQLRTAGGETLEMDVTARAKQDAGGRLLHYEGIATNITQALEAQRNRVLRRAAGGMCHYLNTHLMHMISAKDGIRDELADMELLGEGKTAISRQVWEGVREAIAAYCADMDVACRKIGKVTKAFNSAFLTYREEEYLDSAILDIFGSCLEETQGAVSIPVVGPSAKSPRARKK